MPTMILVVEDHDIVRQSLRLWLEAEFPQCRVMEATSGEQAIDVIQVEPPHLVVTNIRLPGSH